MLGVSNAIAMVSQVDRAGELAPISRENLALQVYRQIRNALKQSYFRPGQKLVLRAVAADLNVSMTPLRDAFARLVSESALLVDSRGCVCVPVISPEQHREIRDLRADLEGRAAYAATSHVTTNDIAELQALNETFYLATLSEDRGAALKANEEFHFKLYGLAGMPILFSMIEGLWLRSGPILARRGPNPRKPIRRHLPILMGLKNSDPALVRQGITEDIFAGWTIRQELRET
jgi:DNA-binding GntR family transcriptional regulator